MSEGWVVGRVYREGKIVTVKEKETLQFTVECRRNVGQKTFSDYISVTAYGKDIHQMQMAKGVMVMISGGRYSARAYTSKDNEMKAALCYNCWTNNITFLESTEARAAQGAQAPAQSQAPQRSARAASPPPPVSADDDVPF